MPIPLIERAEQHPGRTAILAGEGTFTYRQLLEASGRVAGFLLDGKADLEEQPVAFLAPPGFHYVALQWGIWRAGGIAVPLSLYHPRPELEYVIEDTASGRLLAHPDLIERLRPIAEERGLALGLSPRALEHSPGLLPALDARRRAMILYTSGTTGRPKGVVSTHENLAARITSLVEAWDWAPDDRILEILPLHHVHGIINVISCALWAGAVCEILPEFDADSVWDRIARCDLTLLMAVPTIYVKLIDAWHNASPARRRQMTDGCRRMRLMVSGSAALPVSILERWKEISGHVLLERYGMTEIGMALSNPLHGNRVPGAVGTPLPGVEVRLVDETGNPVAPGAPGEIEVRGRAVFSEYWRKPEETLKAFRNGWFMTGDMAVLENGVYRILGRCSVDIIKTGGYKVSALEIEEVLLTHPSIAECAVVGVPDQVWGERVCAAAALRSGTTLNLETLRGWIRDRLASYKAPKEFMVFEKLPRSAMGKVIKPELKELFEGRETGDGNPS
ncbi:MAG: acyl-CoA synthetase [Syntrophobacteraceae bacterium]